MDIIQQYLLRTDDFFVAERVNNIITIFFGAQVMLVTDLNDLTEVKRAIVQLKKIKISTHTISRIFSICRETIDKWFETYQKYGFKTLEKIKHGPKKVTDEIEAYIIFKAKELNFCSAYRKKILEGIKNHFNVKFHVNTISDILRKNKIDISIKKFNKKLEEKENPNNKIDSLKLENLGLLLIFPFLKKFELEKLFFNAQSIFKNKYYSALDYIYTLIILLSVNLIQVEENIKNLKDKNLGVLIGKNNIPCAKTLRKNINTIISNTDMRKFQISLCRNYFNENSNLNELYIDGHFFPYFGSSNIFKGYNSSRRLAMK